MCLIAYRDNPGSHIPNAVIEYNLMANPDGFGLAWRDPEKGLQWAKFAPDQQTEFVTLLKNIDKTDMVYAAHWRTGTSGPKNRELAHPFPYEDKTGQQILCFHNGIISIVTSKDESDTSRFVDSVLSKLDNGWWYDGAMSFLVESSIGWSRILLMTPDEDVFINKDQWKKENGIFYSTAPGPFSAKYGVIGGQKLLPEKVESTDPYYLSGAARGGKTFRSSNYTAAPNVDVDIEPDDDFDDDYAVLVKSVKSKNHSGSKWYHRGHPVTATTQIDSGSEDDDRFGVISCDDCCTDGEYFVIDGELQIDLEHLPLWN